MMAGKYGEVCSGPYDTKGRQRYEIRTAGVNSLSSGFKPTAKLICILAAMLLSTSAFAHQFSRADIKIDHPWSRITSAAPAAGAYLTVTKSGSLPDRLTRRFDSDR